MILKFKLVCRCNMCEPLTRCGLVQFCFQILFVCLLVGACVCLVFCLFVYLLNASYHDIGVPCNASKCHLPRRSRVFTCCILESFLPNALADISYT